MQMPIRTDRNVRSFVRLQAGDASSEGNQARQGRLTERLDRLVDHLANFVAVFLHDLQNLVRFIAYSDAVLVPHDPTMTIHFIIIMLFWPTADRISPRRSLGMAILELGGMGGDTLRGALSPIEKIRCCSYTEGATVRDHGEERLFLYPC